MPTHVALVRGINVGGRKLLMADLRRIVASLGHRDVATYIQSGNVIFTAADSASSEGSPSDSAALAKEMEAAIAEALDIRPAVIVVSKAELSDVVAGNPYADEPQPRFVHAVFLPDEPDSPTVTAVAEAMAQAGKLGSRDQATVRGRVLYLHTPDGFGTSVLAQLLLQKRTSPAADGTARNWATVTKLLALCGG